MGNIIFLGVLFAAFWAILILPQQRRMKAHQALIDSVAAGDRILTSSGLYGTVTEVLDKALYLEIAEGIEILVNRGQVAEILEEFPSEAAPVDDET
jgi:preprotein translocase subunit YajC